MEPDQQPETTSCLDCGTPLDPTAIDTGARYRNVEVERERDQVSMPLYVGPLCVRCMGDLP